VKGAGAKGFKEHKEKRALVIYIPFSDRRGDGEGMKKAVLHGGSKREIRLRNVKGKKTLPNREGKTAGPQILKGNRLGVSQGKGRKHIARGDEQTEFRSSYIEGCRRGTSTAAVKWGPSVRQRGEGDEESKK